MEWLFDATAAETAAEAEPLARNARGVGVERGASFWDGVLPEEGARCSLQIGGENVDSCAQLLAGVGWPRKVGPAVRLSAPTTASFWESSAGYGGESRRAVWLALENGVLSYFEPYFEAAFEVSRSASPVDGGVLLGRMNVSAVEVRASMTRDEDAGEGSRVPSLELTCEEGVLRLLFPSVLEMRCWWSVLVQSQDLARQNRPARSPRAENAERSGERSTARCVRLEQIPLGDDCDESSSSYFDLGLDFGVTKAYEKVLKSIIRPPRADYAVEQLGPRAFEFCGVAVRRVDFWLVNSRGQRLACSRWFPDVKPAPPPAARDTASAADGSYSSSSLWSSFGSLVFGPPADAGFDREAMPTVVYLHGNASCRLESLPILTTCLSLGLSVLSLDTTGSGQSDGEFVSLGHFEQDDVAAAVSHLKDSGVTAVALWGRSMGATTALLYASCISPHLACVVADSAFCSLSELCTELAGQIAPSVPNSVSGAAIAQVAESVQYYAGFSLGDVAPSHRVGTCTTPTLLVHGSADDFIHPRHSRAIFREFGGHDVELQLDKGGHSSSRTTPTQIATRRFLRDHMLHGAPSPVMDHATFKHCSQLSTGAAALCTPWSIVWHHAHRRNRNKHRAPSLVDSLSLTALFGASAQAALAPAARARKIDDPPEKEPAAPQPRSADSKTDEFVAGMSDERAHTIFNILS